VRIDGVLLAAGAAVGGGVCAVYPVPALLCGLVSFAALGMQLSLRARTLVVLVFGLSALRGSLEIRAFEQSGITERGRVSAPEPLRSERGRRQLPVWSDGTASFVAQVMRADCEGRPLPAPFVARLHGGPDGLARQDRVHVIADLAPVQLFRNLGTVRSDPGGSPPRHRPHGRRPVAGSVERHLRLTSLIDRARAHARQRIALTFAPAAAAMARALVLGENDLPADDARAFQKSGLSHMLAVSGTHLVFAVVALVQAIAFLLVRVERLSARFVVARFASLLGVGLSLVYADFAGGGGSAWRRRSCSRSRFWRARWAVSPSRCGPSALQPRLRPARSAVRLRLVLHALGRSDRWC